MVTTSATLSDGQSVGNIARSLGIFSNNADLIKEEHHEPAAFGNVDFVLMDDSLQDPSNSKHDTGDTVASNPEWLDNISAMIGDAATKGKRVVVLTLSTRDTLALEKRLTKRLGKRLLVQRPGIKLQSLVTDYRAAGDGVLITPGGWEGLDLPGQIDELILSRLPYLPPNTPEAIVRTRQLLNAGFDRKTAERVIYAKSLAEARRRFRQGFGRGIRRHDDSVRVWIGDPRFIQRKDFQQVVPRRFREATGLSVPALSKALTWTLGGIIKQKPEQCIAASWAEDCA